MDVGRVLVLVVSLLCGARATGQWTDLGFGLAGSQGVPALAGSGSLLPGTSVSLLLTKAHPNIDDWLVVGLAGLFAPYKGGTMVPSTDLIIPLVTDAAGSSTVGGPWPSGLPGGLGIWFQCWILDPAAPKGLAASNALLATTP